MKRIESFVSLCSVVLFSWDSYLWSQEIPDLEDGHIYVAFTSDHEGERESDDTFQFEFESIYVLSSEHLGGSYDDMVRRGVRVSQLGGCRSPVWDLEGNRLAYIEFELESDENRITIIDFGGGQRRTLSVAATSSLAGLSWTADGTKLAYVEHDRGICLVDVETGESSVVLEHPSPEHVILSPNGKWIAFQSSDGPKPFDHDSWRLNLMNIETNERYVIGEIDDDEGVVEKTYWSSDSQALYVPLRFSIDENDSREYKPSLFRLETMEYEAAAELPENIYDQQFRFWKIVQ